MENKLKDALTAYNTATGAIASPPEWFVETMRSQGTRNITIDTWNALCTNVRRLAANGAAADELIKVFGDLLNEIISNVEATKAASKVPVKYDSNNILFESVDGTERVVIPNRIPSNILNGIYVIPPQVIDDKLPHHSYKVTQIDYANYGARIHYFCEYAGCLSDAHSVEITATNWNIVTDKKVGDDETLYPIVFINVITCNDRISGNATGLPNRINVSFDGYTGKLTISADSGDQVMDYSYSIDIEVIDGARYYNERFIIVKVIQMAQSNNGG